MSKDMVTEKQKCIAEQSIYGDMCFVNPSGSVRKLDVVSSIVAYGDKGGIFAPILRPLSDLTKEITHKGYNDDKPFVPLVELAKINNPEYTSIEINERGRIFINTPYAENVTMVYDSNNAIFINMQISKNGNYKLTTSRASINQQPLFDLLNLWHFDTRNLIATGEAIDVNTLDINPYSVKL